MTDIFKLLDKHFAGVHFCCFEIPAVARTNEDIYTCSCGKIWYSWDDETKWVPAGTFDMNPDFDHCEKAVIIRREL